MSEKNHVRKMQYFRGFRITSLAKPNILDSLNLAGTISVTYYVENKNSRGGDYSKIAALQIG